MKYNISVQDLETARLSSCFHTEFDPFFQAWPVFT
jgi:hypothetical protein